MHGRSKDGGPCMMSYLSMHAANRAQKIRKPSAKNPQTERKKIRKPSAKNPQTERKKSANRAQKIRKPSAKNPQTERKKSANRAQKIRKPSAKNPQTERKKSANRAQKIRKPSAKNRAHFPPWHIYMHIDHACDWTRLLYSTTNASSATTSSLISAANWLIHSSHESGTTVLGLCHK